MNPTPRQMRAFVAVANTGHFTLAAQYMHVTHSALSGLVKKLEQTLGARVVDRSLVAYLVKCVGARANPIPDQRAPATSPAVR